jgi:hypothetical protein
MPNSLAFLMLAIWPVVVGVLFQRLAPRRALVWGLLGAYLLLPPPPAGFDFPLMPVLDKQSLPSLAVLAFALIFVGGRISLWPESRIARLLILIFVFSPVATVLTNREPVIVGIVHLPGLKLIEAAALVILQGLVLVPFLLGRSLLADAKGQREIMLALLIGGLIYSLPMLLEVRLSPQLNIWIYGYFQHVFEQMVRGGGFRPIVFLYHGLWAALFMMTATIAAIALFRAEGARGRVYLILAWYLGIVLVLCKSLGAVLYAIALAPLVLLLGRMMQLRLAVVIALAALTYPAMKAGHMVPDDFLVGQAAQISAERAASLQFRFDNENILFERAQLKPLFGWGSWGRNHEYDPEGGDFLTVTDGRWVITLGVFGWVGYLAEFGLLALPILLLWFWARRLPPDQVGPLTWSLVLLLAFNFVDLIPNATLTPLTWLIAGSLLGSAELSRKRYRKPEVIPVRTVL